MTAAHLDDQIRADMVAQVQAMIDEAEKTGTRAAAWETIQQVLLDNKLAWRSQIPPEMVGVHPENRSRLGVGGSGAHFHGAQILSAGFSWRKASDATCLEAPPAPYDDEAKLANEKYAAVSGGAHPSSDIHAVPQRRRRAYECLPPGAQGQLPDAGHEPRGRQRSARLRCPLRQPPGAEGGGAERPALVHLALAM